MIRELEPSRDPSISRQFGTVADEASVKRSAAALEANGIKVLWAADAAEAKRIVLELIPDGAQVHHGQVTYGIHSAVNKVLIINREVVPGRITVVFVDQVLGF
jgi:hypothetical protein